MIPENYKNIIEKLLEKTNNKQANWQKSSGANEFKLLLKKGAVTIDMYTTKNGTDLMEFSVMNEQREIIDQLLFSSDEVTEFIFLMKLHDSAKRAYYKVDETINNLIEELDSDKKIGLDIPNDDLPF